MNALVDLRRDRIERKSADTQILHGRSTTAWLSFLAFFLCEIPEKILVVFDLPCAIDVLLLIVFIISMQQVIQSTPNIPITYRVMPP